MHKFAILIFSLYASVALAATCPDKITTQQSLSRTAHGWTTFQDKNDIHILRAVDFYDGKPEKMVQLAPDNADSGKDPIWNFAGVTEIWQVCRYTNTKVSLTRKIESVKSCTVKYDKEVKPQVNLVDCK